MWIIIFVSFLSLYALMSYYIGRRTWYVIEKLNILINKRLFWSLFLLLMLAFPLAELLEDFLPASSGVMLTIFGGYSMIFVLYIFLMILLIDLLLLLNKGIGFIPTKFKEHSKTPHFLVSFVLLTIITTITYGAWNAKNPIVNEYSLTVNKSNEKVDQLHVAMISDVHFGAIIDANRVGKMVEMINDLQPDMILIAGDLTEGNVSEEEAKSFADTLGQLQAQYGVFAVPGNHDRDLRDDNSALSISLEEANIDVLKDEYIEVADSFYVIGRHDPGYRGGPQRMELEEVLLGMDTSKPMILIDHQPNALEESQQNGVDLQVSGHTHKGQIFPANFITGQIFELDWGFLKKDEYHLIVSNGIGTWGPPLRVGNNPEIVSIIVDFK